LIIEDGKKRTAQNSVAMARGSPIASNIIDET
jgi:hypothetical protein